MMQNKSLRVLFFGSTDDSVIILDKLFGEKDTFQFGTVDIIGVVTQPATPIGRKQIITPTPVEVWAKKHTVPVLTFPHDPTKVWNFQNETTVCDTLAPLRADLIISASFGQKIPWEILSSAQFGGLNVHPSLLPRWRGGDPVPWMLIAGDAQAGVSIVTLSEKFDDGRIVAQKKIPVPQHTFSDPLRTELFTIGATLLTSVLATFKGQTFKGSMQDPKKATYARRLTRADGYVPWELLVQAVGDLKVDTTHLQTLPVVSVINTYEKIPDSQAEVPVILARMIRALNPWPGVWTEVRVSSIEHRASEKKRLKILQAHLTKLDPPAGGPNPKLEIDEVQLEGKKPVSWAQFSNAYFPQHSHTS